MFLVSATIDNTMKIENEINDMGKNAMESISAPNIIATINMHGTMETRKIPIAITSDFSQIEKLSPKAAISQRTRISIA